jgi:hypothetical protein
MLISWATPFLEKQEGTPALLRWKIQQCHYHIAASDADHGILAAEEGLKLAEQCTDSPAGFRFYRTQSLFLSFERRLRHFAKAQIINSNYSAKFDRRSLLLQFLSCLEATSTISRAKEHGALAAISTKSHGLNGSIVSTLFIRAEYTGRAANMTWPRKTWRKWLKLQKASHSSLVKIWALFAQADEGPKQGCPDQGHMR